MYEDIENGEEVGQLVERGLPGSFLWKIPEFPGLPLMKGNSREIPDISTRFFSPNFSLGEMKWGLGIFPEGEGDFTDRMLLRLWRWDTAGPQRTLHCSVGVQRADGSEEHVGTQIVRFSGFKGVIYEFGKRMRECKEGDWLAPDTLTLTLTLRIREVEEDVSQGVVILSKHIKGLLEKSEDCDIKIHVNNKVFLGHRCILKSRSPVFEMMLTHDCTENNSGVISIGDCDTEAFEELMFYMYSGKTRDLTPTKAINLYYIADKYSFPDLKEQCIRSLETSLSTSNICDVILLSAKYESDLFNTVMNFFVQNTKEILETVEWENFLAKHPKEANELYLRKLEFFHPQM